MYVSLLHIYIYVYISMYTTIHPTEEEEEEEGRLLVEGGRKEEEEEERLPGGSKAKEEGTTHLLGEAAVVAAEEIRAGRGDGNSSGLLGRWRRQAEGWRIAQPRTSEACARTGAVAR